MMDDATERVPTVRSMTSVSAVGNSIERMLSLRAIIFRRIAPGTRREQLPQPAPGRCPTVRTINTLWDARLVAVVNADVHLQGSWVACVLGASVDAPQYHLGRPGKCDIFFQDALGQADSMMLEPLNGDWSGRQ